MFTANSGIKRSIFGQTGDFQFNFNIITDSLFGGVNFGVSGSGAGLLNNPIKINTFCNSGKIWDNSGRFVGVYYPNEQFSVSGNVIKDRYDLFIDGKPVVFGNVKPTGTINYFYLQPSQITCQYNSFVNGARPNLAISNVICGTGAARATGYIGNLNSQIPVRIFSGDFTNLSSNSSFSLSGLFTGNLLGSGAYYIVPGGSESLGSYNGNLRLYTNGGVLDYSNIINITGIESLVVPVINLNGVSIIYDGQNNSYTSDISFLASSGVPIFATLTHVSGSGDYYKYIDVVSGYSGIVNNYIQNTGYVTQYFSSIGTGQGGQLNNTGSGFVSGFITGNNITYARGTFVWPLTVATTGIGTGNGYTGLASGFYYGNITGTIIGDSGTLLYNENNSAPISRTVSTLFNVTPTGYIHGSGQIYYNSPSNFDKLYLRDGQDAIVYNFHYNSLNSLVSFINANTGSLLITAVASGINSVTVSGIRGPDTDITLRMDDSNAGTMAVSGPQLYGGVDLGVGVLTLNSISPVTGFYNNILTGSGYYNDVGIGVLNGSGIIVDYTKTFTGLFNFFSGLDNQVNYRAAGFYNSSKDKYLNNFPSYFNNSTAFMNVEYQNKNDTLRDVVLLQVSGSGFNLVEEILITGNY